MRLTAGRSPLIVVVLLAAVLVPSSTVASAGEVRIHRPDGPVVPSGIGAGIYFVAGTADYEFALAESGMYYLTMFADRDSLLKASLSQDGTPLETATVQFGGVTLVELEQGTYALHLEGSGKAALGWNFVAPGTQEFPTNQRLVAALAPGSDNRLTVSVLGPSALSVHILAYNEEMDLGLDALFSSGDSTTFDFPWATSNWVTLVAEPRKGLGPFRWRGPPHRRPSHRTHSSFHFPLR